MGKGNKQAEAANHIQELLNKAGYPISLSILTSPAPGSIAKCC
jgi:hypothetical protein